MHDTPYFQLQTLSDRQPGKHRSVAAGPDRSSNSAARDMIAQQRRTGMPSAPASLPSASTGRPKFATIPATKRDASQPPSRSVTALKYTSHSRKRPATGFVDDEQTGAVNKRRRNPESGHGHSKVPVPRSVASAVKPQALDSYHGDCSAFSVAPSGGTSTISKSRKHITQRQTPTKPGRTPCRNKQLRTSSAEETLFPLPDGVDANDLNDWSKSENGIERVMALSAKYRLPFEIS